MTHIAYFSKLDELRTERKRLLEGKSDRIVASRIQAIDREIMTLKRGAICVVSKS